jgi:hypothetical protein
MAAITDESEKTSASASVVARLSINGTAMRPAPCLQIVPDLELEKANGNPR